MGAAAKRLNQEPVIEPEALPCPFCGSPATIEYWHGGRPSKRMISCSDAADTPFGRPDATCHVGPSVTGETRAEALRRWNGRKS